MALPLMDPDPTITAIRVRPGREALTLDTPVGIAGARLWQSGEAAAVVADHGHPVGIMTVEALDRCR